MSAIHRLKLHIFFPQLYFCIARSTVKLLWFVVLRKRDLRIPVFGAGAKAFDGELPACALEAPGQITDLLPLLSKAAKLEAGTLYAMVAPFRGGSQDHPTVRLVRPRGAGRDQDVVGVRLWAPLFYPVPLQRSWTRTWILLEA